MNKIEFALKLAKDCSYSDIMTDGAKKHLRKEIDLALDLVKNLTIPVVSVSVCGMNGVGFCPHEFDNGKCNYNENCVNKRTEL